MNQFIAYNSVFLAGGYMKLSDQTARQIGHHVSLSAGHGVWTTIRCAVLIAVGMSVLVTTAAAFAQNNTCTQRYQVTDLGAVKEYIGPDVVPGLNSMGKVTLWQQNAKDRTFFPVLWSDGARTPLSVPVGYHNAFADAVNDEDIAVGWANTSLNPLDSLSTTHAFLFQGNRTVDLGTLSGRDSHAYAINRHGVIVGVSDVDLDRHKNRERAFRYSDGKMTPLPSLAGGKFSIAFSINGSGSIAGTSEVLLPGAKVPAKHATVWRKDRPYDLGALTPQGNSMAYSINAHGDVTGAADLGAGQSVFLNKNDGKMRDLNIEGRGYAINDKDQIVGIQEAISGTAPPFAFLWDQGHDIDLNGCLISGAGVKLLYAYRINNAGQIVAIGHMADKRVQGIQHALLLTPGN
jgi:probable HAF family extracellular repeat protein